ncbi:MAG: energy transducer TonB [Bryobacteraceae bacterium]
MAEQLPNNPIPERHEADAHLDHLLAPASVNTPLIVSLIQSIKELINPPKLPPLEITSKPIEIDTKKGAYAGNEWKAGALSIVINVGVLGLLIFIGTNKEIQEAIKENVIPLVAPVMRKPPPLPPKDKLAGGGGGGSDKTPDTKGKLPPIAKKQFIPPTVHTVENPKLSVSPTIIASADLPNIDSPNFGDPLAGLGVPSNGIGGGGGIGPGKGPGVGPGSGGGYGGGVFKIGGGVSAPQAIVKPEPEYSEEARKAKYQGEVWLSVIVDEKGVPQDIKVTRKLGLGLDEKAIEAVKKWRFKPGMKDGKPVAVQATIAVSFHLL